MSRTVVPHALAVVKHAMELFKLIVLLVKTDFSFLELNALTLAQLNSSSNQRLKLVSAVMFPAQSVMGNCQVTAAPAILDFILMEQIAQPPVQMDTLEMPLRGYAKVY